MDNLVGMQLGPYQIISAIGAGGMAAVYKAYQPATERYVALKILPRHLASDPQFVSRFQQEAKIVAQLQHPHILPVFDFGEVGGYTYLVMPFVVGGTLADALTGRPLPLPQICAIISQVGDALDYAHARGLIHRDVKPSNILVDERGNCLLTDFGLAKMVEGSIRLTASGAILGTPAYMSPEQGLDQPLDRRSDIYSLGVILYEMAVGRVPYSAETPIAVVFKHVNDPLPLPRAVNPDVPEALERIILKTLAKKPEDRYATAGEMVDALQTILPAKPVKPTPRKQQARFDATRQRAAEFAPTLRTPPSNRGISAFKWAFVAGGLFLAMCIGLFALLIIGTARTNRPPFAAAPTAASLKPNTPVATVQREYTWDLTPLDSQGTMGLGVEVFDPGRVFGGGWVGNGCAMRFLTGGQSWMEVTFTIPADPQTGRAPVGKWSLLIYHLSSAVDDRHAGFSPVQVSLNGQSVWKGSPGQGAAGPGNLWTADTCDVSNAIRQGSNTLRWDFLNGATTHYWLKSFRLAWSPSLQ